MLKKVNQTAYFYISTKNILHYYQPRITTVHVIYRDLTEKPSCGLNLQ